MTEGRPTRSIRPKLVMGTETACRAPPRAKSALRCRGPHLLCAPRDGRPQRHRARSDLGWWSDRLHRLHDYAAGSGFEDLGGWLPEYAPGPISGVGVAATIVGRVDVETGTLDRATFVIAVTASQDVAEHVPLGSPTVLEDGSVELLGSSQESPIDTDAATAMDCGGPSPHASQYVFSGDLAQLVCASASGCTPQMACPD